MEKSPFRLLLLLQRYGFDLQYKPGKEQIVADMLSRPLVKENNPTADQQKSKTEIFMADIDDNKPTKFTDISEDQMRRI